MIRPASISAVIPTRGRPALVVRAVASALGQTLRDIEVVVVIDGPDAATLRALRAVDDPRLVILPLPVNLGLAGARHAGIEAARGAWIALLDDDDEWLPRKLEIQLNTARRSRHRTPIVTCRVIARTEQGDAIRPRRVLATGEALCEYLFCKTRLSGGEGLVLPSTLLVPKALFRDGGPRFRPVPSEGSDWLLRAVARDGVGVEFVATQEPLAIWHCEDSRVRLSTSRDWRESLAWAKAEKGLLTPRARASFILNRVSAEARRAGDASAFWRLPREAFRCGRPTSISLFAHAITWLLPRRVRAALVRFRNRRPG